MFFIIVHCHSKILVIGVIAGGRDPILALRIELALGLHHPVIIEIRAIIPVALYYIFGYFFKKQFRKMPELIRPYPWADPRFFLLRLLKKENHATRDQTGGQQGICNTSDSGCLPHPYQGEKSEVNRKYQSPPQSDLHRHYNTSQLTDSVNILQARHRARKQN